MSTETPSLTAGEPKKSPACYVTTVARLLFGLGFFLFGLNGFFNFLPQPKTMPQAAQDFFVWMTKSGYLIQLLFGTQILVGALLLINRFVPLALALIAPVIVNIVAFHLFLVPSGLPMAIVFLALELYLAWAYRKAFAPMLAARTTPGPGDRIN